ncbi:MAG: hypothetical protein N3F63_02820 [Thermoplasmata archaeon]|nr:hypothetical protein [Thermoplasmata archaeon]
MIRWVNFLHIYQPPVQTAYWVRRIANECYLPLFRLLAETPDVRVTVNISGVLLEHFEALEINEVFELIDRLRVNQNVEFTGSAAYHPILPLLPVEECVRQIALNEHILEKTAGIKKPDGFFLPEMCYSPAVSGILEKMGYKWVILDEIACPGKTCGIIRGTNVRVILRNRAVSNALNTYALHLEDLVKNFGKMELWISATDGEIYGHHKKNFWLIFKDLQGSGVRTMTVSEFLAEGGSEEPVAARACSWASTEEELNQGIHYPRWYNQHNELHLLQWAIAVMAFKIGRIEESQKAREFLDKAVFSCQYYWANPGILWYPGMVLKGLKLWERFFRACQAMDDFTPIAGLLKRKLAEHGA